MRLSVLVIVLAVAGCAGSKAARHAPPPVDQASLVDMGQVSWNFVWRQSITAEYSRPNSSKRETASFEAVLQKQGETLTMVGLTPFGSRAFVAHQTGRVVKLDEVQAGQQLPFPPEFIFLDVNHCFFVGLSTTAAADGWHNQQLGGETIADQWQSGRLLQRVFRSGSSTSPITIRYGGGFIPGTAPTDVELVNGRFNYRLTIKTLQSETL